MRGRNDRNVYANRNNIIRCSCGDGRLKRQGKKIQRRAEDLAGGRGGDRGAKRQVKREPGSKIRAKGDKMHFTRYPCRPRRLHVAV